jgi:hypothetical protein
MRSSPITARLRTSQSSGSTVNGSCRLRTTWLMMSAL